MATHPTRLAWRQVDGIRFKRTPRLCDNMDFNTGLLRDLLIRTQRKCHIMGKGQNQVAACVLRCDEGVATTTSLVRDGKTSLSRFSIPCGEGTTALPIPDIDRILGVLKAHGDTVKLSVDGVKSRILIKSKGK